KIFCRSEKRLPASRVGRRPVLHSGLASLLACRRRWRLATLTFRHGSLGCHWGGKTHCLALSGTVQTISDKCPKCKGFARISMGKMSVRVGGCPASSLEV